MTETGEISKLVDILHQNGDKVLNALSKLSLNVTLLQKINKEFETFLENDKDNEKFHVLSNSSTSSQIIQDLHFLHDFMQKTVGLKIINNANLMLLDNKVDISKFKSIKYLEIKKVPVKEITGLKVVQPQLESIVCMKCLSKLEELLAECGGDNSNGFVWSELKEAVLSYNNIKILDTSIAFAPWLQILDLSHNKLVNVKAIECLPNLKYINLSFNCLSAIPTFSKSARKRMQVLVMKNNYIEDLSGLAGLDYLTELDVSWNWVSNYDCLQPLLTMSALQNFTLKRNPINFHKNYRKIVVGYFHISASFGDFLFDGSKLTKFEKSMVGYKLCQSVRTISLSNPGPGPTSSSPPVIQSRNAETGTSDKASVPKKSGKVRLAVIPNLDDGTFEEIPAGSSAINFKGSTSTEHLITKKRIEEARATYGSDNWLRCEAGTVIQDILGLPPNEVLSSTPVDYRSLEAGLKCEENKTKSKGVIENISELTDKANFESFSTCVDDYPSDYYSLDNQNNQPENSAEKHEEKTDSKETSPDFETIQESSEEIEDENEKLYLVSRISKCGNNEAVSEELFLTLTELELKEKDYNRGRVINKWSISSLESCVKLQANKLQLGFDTVNRGKRERIYEMEEAEAHTLFKILTEILESRTLQDMNQIAYKCFSCSSQFSKIIHTRKQGSNSRCPFCNSKLVLEVDDHSPSDEEKSAEKRKKQPSKADKLSHNRSSSTGVISGVINQAPHKVVKCSSQSSIGSAASLDELNELPAVQGASAKRSDSDIEILSNPSQSSIEVIDGPSRTYGGNTPGRKRSSEERQIQPSITLPESLAHSSNVGLTESSSSGSVTDSVCTAYESSGPQMVHKVEHPIVTEEGQEISIINKGKHKFPTVLEREEAPENKNFKYQNWNKFSKTRDEIQYSYTDFTKVDHRIKLFLYSQIFEDNSEEFSFGLRCSVLLINSSNAFESFVVFSNKKFYILKIIGLEEGDDASKFLQKSSYLMRNVKLLKTISPLAWEQGFSFKLEDVNDELKEFLIFLKDQNRTQNFLKFIQSSDAYLPTECNVIAEFSQKPVLAMQHLLVSGASEDSSIRYFTFLRACSVIRYPDVKDVQSVAILVTNTDLLLFSSEPLWFFDGNDSPLQPVFCQKLKNLMSAEAERCRIYLQFINVLNKNEEIWDVTVETEESLQHLINAIKSPWEGIFSIPLHVTTV